MEGLDRIETPSPEPIDLIGLMDDDFPEPAAAAGMPIHPQPQFGNEFREIPHVIFNNEMPHPPDAGNNEEVIDMVAAHQLALRRHYVEHNIRPEDLAPGGFFNPIHVDADQPLPVLNADGFDEQNDRLQAARIVEILNEYLDPDRIRVQARQELEQARIRRAREREAEMNNNNNANFRNNNNNGYPSPSPSPSPPASPDVAGMVSDDEEANQDPEEQARPNDMEIDQLLEQIAEMKTPHPRPRKRQNTDCGEEVQKKRVTFKDERDKDKDDEAGPSTGRRLSSNPSRFSH